MVLVGGVCRGASTLRAASVEGQQTNMVRPNYMKNRRLSHSYPFEIRKTPNVNPCRTDHYEEFDGSCDEQLSTIQSGFPSSIRIRPTFFPIQDPLRMTQ